jgi:glycerophosphoryl diester phosphodiesterase
LLDALDHGFTSVEADIFLVDGKLVVAHTKREIDPAQTLDKLYLEPLHERIQANGGSVYGDGKPFHLLIDLKSAGEPTYAALHQLLSTYAAMLSSTKDGNLKPGAVTISISGDRPIATIKGQSQRFAGIDGRISDLDSDEPADVMPLISDNWFSHFRWLGSGEFKEADRQKLRDYVLRAHAKGRKVRFWAAPDTPAAWRELQAAGVDLINTDNLAGLESFLRKQPADNK